MDIIDELDFVMFEFKMHFRCIAYIAQGPWYLKVKLIELIWRSGTYTRTNEFYWLDKDKWVPE